MKPLETYPVLGSIRLLERGKATARGDVHMARLGEDVRIDTKLLDDYCFATPNGLTYDLMSVLGAVKYADRSVKRIPSEGWGRRLLVEIPVFEKSRWNAPDVLHTLEDCLGYLTGDEWRFDFRQRKSRPANVGQSHVVESPQRLRVFLPYSHGLDSFAQLRLLQTREPDTEVICVLTDNKPHLKGWKEFCRSKLRGGVKPVQVPVIVDEPHHAEPTFRARPFLYYLLSAYGALRTKSNRVLIPENGQGSLGGSLVPMGSESRHRSCHPGFTIRLSRFVSALTGEKVTFEHPAIFQTKGQVLAGLREVDSDSSTWLQEHWSCSHDQRHSHRQGARVHCGVCGNCILRRVSSKHAGIQDVTAYKFENAQAEMLEMSLQHGDEIPREMKGFRDLAWNSVRSMQRMADLAEDSSAPEIWAEAEGFSRYMDEEVEQSHAKLMTLLGQHQREWNEYLADCGGNSWACVAARC